ELAHRIPLPFPPFLITSSKDLVVFRTPGRPLIELPIRRLFEPANSSPEFRPHKAWFVFQNPFNRAVRTSPATLHSFAQNSIDFFRREKPERVVVVRTNTTICHGKGHHAESVGRTGLLR